MNRRVIQGVALAVGLGGLGLAAAVRADPPPTSFRWRTVVNDADLIPGLTKVFNSYNQPSVNEDALVVFRARGKGPGEPPHGIFTRDMAQASNSILKVADRSTLVPQPNNQGATFIEFPSFPRIDRDSDAVAFRGNSQPVYRASPESELAGTTGVFSTPGGVLVTGASNLGDVPGFDRFAVPGVEPALAFDVFPGAPSITDGITLVFKGNYTQDGVSKTGVYYRDLRPAAAGGPASIQLLANNSDTAIPGTDPAVVFGSVSPPSAANGTAVFSGFDDENAPTVGGIYRVPLSPEPGLRPLVEIGGPVPDWRGLSTGETFTLLGEGVSYDGRFVGFWAAWGGETRPVVVHCPAEGNKLRQAYCLSLCPEPAGCTFQVPVHQGIFVQDTELHRTFRAAETGARFQDFLFWNFSGKVPGQQGDDEGEPARWRSSAFVAVDGRAGATFQAAFKGSLTDGTTSGIYLSSGPGRALLDPVTVVDTTLDGAVLDPQAAGTLITVVGLERDGFRGGNLTINASMGSEETGWAGIYLTRVPQPAGERERER